MSFYDELGPLVNPSALRREVCNRAAARFMKMCFDVDTSNPPTPGPAMRGSSPSTVITDDIEPDMTRAGDKHIKPCRGLNCSELILWAKHVKKDGSIGNVAPLVKAKPGETPNIIAWYDEKTDQWFYKIKGAKSEVRGIAEYVNHYMNCESKGEFK